MPSSVEIAGVQLACDRQGHRQDRVAERVLARRGRRGEQSGPGVPGPGRGFRSGWHVRHSESVARFVRRSKGVVAGGDHLTSSRRAVGFALQVGQSPYEPDSPGGVASGFRPGHTRRRHHPDALSFPGRSLRSGATLLAQGPEGSALRHSPATPCGSGVQPPGGEGVIGSACGRAPR